MSDQGKTRAQLLQEVAEMRARIAALELAVADGTLAQQAIRQAYREAQRYLDLAGVVMVVLDRCGNIRLLNRKGYAILGYANGDLLGVNWFDTCVPETIREEVKLIFGELIAGKVVAAEYYDNPVITRSGEERIIAWHNAVLTDKEGTVVGTLSSGLDITDRKQAEEALQAAYGELEQRIRERTADLAMFRRLADSSAQGFGMADMGGCITYVNRALCRMFGEEAPEAVVGKHVATFYSPEYARQREQEILPALLHDEHWHGEVVIRPKHGNAMIVLQHSFLIRDDNAVPIRLASVITDITERKQTEEALQRSHDELYALYDGMTDGLLIADVESKRFLRANASISRMLGYSPEQLLSMSVMDIHPPESIPDILAAFEALVQRRIRSIDDLPVLRRDGSVFFASVSANALVLDGRLCVAGFFRDITERKRANEALERERSTLRHLLQASDHERQLIAYEIHDELAQLLAGAIMQFETYEDLKEKRPRDATRAYDAGRTMVQQSHLEARRLISGVRPPILDESGIVAAVAHLVHEQRRQKGPKIEYLSKVEFERLAPILENAIYRICQEALANACRHSKSQRVQVHLIQHGDAVSIEVQDHGIGFCPEDIPESRFGIAGIRERARLLGGTFSIESEPEKGTRIKVELPLVLEKVACCRHATEAEAK